MEITRPIINGASMNAHHYAKVIHNSSELGMVCVTDQIEDGKQWARYKLKCGHIAHTHCFRNWCGLKNKVICPLCSDIETVKDNRYCSYCKKYGHTDMVDGCERSGVRKEQAAFRKTKVVTCKVR